MISVKKNKLKRVLAIVIITVITLTAMSWVVTKIVYDSIFTRYDGDIQTVSFASKHSYGELCGYLYGDGGRALIVLAPGFHAEVGDYIEVIEHFTASGYGVFAFDPLGHGESGGNSSVGFCREITDLNETIKYIEKNNRFGYNDIVLFGHSRGGYAVSCGDYDKDDVAAVVTVGGVNSAMDGVVGLSTTYVGPLAYGNYLGLYAYQRLLFGKELVSLSADECIQKSGVPTLIIHGRDDKTVPIDKYSIMSCSEDITRDGVEFIETSGGHVDILFKEDLLADIVDFIDRNIG